MSSARFDQQPPNHDQRLQKRTHAYHVEWPLRLQSPSRHRYLSKALDDTQPCGLRTGPNHVAQEFGRHLNPSLSERRNTLVNDCKYL